MAQPAKSMAVVALAVALFLAIATKSSSAFPTLFLNSATCGKQPDGPRGPHLAPMLGPDITFVIKSLPNGIIVQAPGPLVVGTNYTVQVNWPEFHRALLTTSTGMWASPTLPGCALSVACNPPLCPVQTLSLASATSDKVVIAVTHSQPGAHFLQGNVTFAIQGAAQSPSPAPKPKSPSPPLRKPPAPKPKSPSPKPKSPSPPVRKPPSPAPKAKSPPPPATKPKSPPPARKSPPPARKPSPPAPKAKASPPPRKTA